MKRIRILAALVMTTMLAPLFGDDVLSTNSWTRGFSLMAGVESDLLAPSEMTHPPEYELKPSDVKKINDSKFLVYAGYEVLMKTVFDSFNKSEDDLIRINTGYAPAIVEGSVLAIAQKTGTTAKAKENITEYKKIIEAAREELKKAGVFGKSVVVNFHQKTLTQALGFNIIGVFGPQPLSAKTIGDLGKLKPDFIIDNIHNTMAAPLEEIYNKESIVLVNFPGYVYPSGTKAPETLTGIAKSNIDTILSFVK